MTQSYERPFRPIELSDSTATAFPLLSMAQQLMSEEGFAKTGRSALTLVRDNALTIVIMALKDQAELHDHSAPGPISITALSGHLEFTTVSESEPLRLMTGDTAVCAAHLAHRVKALEDSAFILVVGGQAERTSTQVS